MPPRTCEYCERVFDALTAAINRGGARFCSTSCRGHSRRSLVEVPCARCERLVERKPSQLSRNRYVFCGKGCMNDAAKDVEHPFSLGPEESAQRCGRCDKRTKAKSLICRACTQATKIEAWLAGDLSVTYSGANKEPCAWVKEHLLSERGDRCEQCGFVGHAPDGRSIIQMDHMDGNYLNNAIGNLKLLCPNCHALTPTFGARNKGSGRTARGSTRHMQT